MKYKYWMEVSYSMQLPLALVGAFALSLRCAYCFYFCSTVN